MKGSFLKPRTKQKLLDNNWSTTAKPPLENKRQASPTPIPAKLSDEVKYPLFTVYNQVPQYSWLATED
jgi:hypothetical protein